MSCAKWESRAAAAGGPGGCLGGGDGMVCVCECDNSKTGREDSMMQTWSCVG